MRPPLAGSCRRASKSGLPVDLLNVEAALELAGARPAALAPRSRLRARRAADRRVALVVQRVVREVALVDAPPEIPLGPVGERVVLPDPAALVALDELR